jgi:uncharacterized protein (TIGR00251 family)
MLEVLLKPNARRSRIVSVEGRCVRASVTAPPVEGKANRELIRLLSETLAVPKSAVEIARGATSKRKMVRIAGIDPAEALRRCMRSAET